MKKQSEVAIATLRRLSVSADRWTDPILKLGNDLNNLASYFEQELSDLEKAIDAYHGKCNSLTVETKCFQNSLTKVEAERDDYKRKYESLNEKVQELAFDHAVEVSVFTGPPGKPPPFPGTCGPIPF
jgi:chromosome segregation ATPase